ncbi:MAG: hypothetical protein Q7S32_04125 [bacterium]|nr:hypothetical protein [bacterium]
MKKQDEMEKWVSKWVANGGELRDEQYDEVNEVAVGLARFSQRGRGIGQVAVVRVFRGSESNSTSHSYVYRDPDYQWKDDFKLSWKEVKIIKVTGESITVLLKNPNECSQAYATFSLRQN